MGIESIADPQQGGEALAGVKPLTRWYNTALERIILAEPSQYWWVHRRWKGSPEQRRRKPAAAQRAAANSAKRNAA
jgi:lauroyl/myristoyl acyltransferase